MYVPRSIAESTTPQTATLAAVAATRRLVVCIGAGFSVAPPTDLPQANLLAQDVHGRLVAHLGALPACDVDNLTSVADVAAALPTGLELVRRTSLEAADFTTAAPNHGHKTLAMLLLEGLVTALSWNWDTCVERSGNGEQVLTIITDEDRRDIADPALLKLHGCAFHPPSMLITTEDLQVPRPWVEAEMTGRLADSVVVFIGVGDVAGYTRDQVKRVADAVGDVGHVYVVSPGIVADWPQSMWAQLVPILPAANRVAATAEKFMEALAASILSSLLAKIATAAGTHPPLVTAASAVSNLVRDSDALTVLRFGRSSGVRVRGGVPCLNSNNGRRAMLALGTVLPDSLPAALRETHVELTDTRVHLLISPDDRPVGDFVRDARMRLVHARNVGYEGEIRFICSGALGPLPQGPASDVIGDLDPDDIVAGAQAEQPALFAATAMLEAA